MSARGASEATFDQLMGHGGGPAPDRLRSDRDRPAVLVGFTPAVHEYPSVPESAVQHRISAILDRACVMLTFVFWVVLPVLGVIGLIAGS